MNSKGGRRRGRSLRIIGGKWRGRKVAFPDNGAIRPTGDRIRETMFNWLGQDLAGARCLDLYAGSGVMSMEALSRGAAHATLVERDARAAAAIRRNLRLLGAAPGSYALHEGDARRWLTGCDEQFDIVFLDPPFDQGRLLPVCGQIAEGGIAGRYVCLESGGAIPAEQLPPGWRLHRHKTAGAVHYGLCVIG